MSAHTCASAIPEESSHLRRYAQYLRENAGRGLVPARVDRQIAESLDSAATIVEVEARLALVRQR